MLVLFKTTVFYAIIDIVIAQLRSRIESMNAITNLFSFLFPKNLISYKDAELLQKATAMQQLNKKDIYESFPMQLFMFVLTLRSEIEKFQKNWPLWQ